MIRQADNQVHSELNSTAAGPRNPPPEQLLLIARAAEKMAKLSRAAKSHRDVVMLKKRLQRAVYGGRPETIHASPTEYPGHNGHPLGGLVSQDEHESAADRSGNSDGQQQPGAASATLVGPTAEDLNYLAFARRDLLRAAWQLSGLLAPFSDYSSDLGLRDFPFGAWPLEIQQLCFELDHPFTGATSDFRLSCSQNRDHPLVFTWFPPATPADASPPPADAELDTLVSWLHERFGKHRLPDWGAVPDYQFDLLTGATADRLCSAFERPSLATNLLRAGRGLSDALAEVLRPDIFPPPRILDPAPYDDYGHPGSNAPETVVDPFGLVTLSEAAAIVNRGKRTLERLKTAGQLPDPAVEGGGGRADLYDWKVMRPWLESKFCRKLPVAFPSKNRDR